MNGDAKIRNSNDEIFMLIWKDKIREHQKERGEGANEDTWDCIWILHTGLKRQ